MIVDCYTCIWDSPAQLGLGAADVSRPSPDEDAVAGRFPPHRAGRESHQAAITPSDKTIVLGFKSAFLEADIPNDFVADYVKSNPERLIGFAGIDPTDPSLAADELVRARVELGLRGIALSPGAQNFHPCHTDAKATYDLAQKHGMPVIFHRGMRMAPQCVMSYAQPVLLDEVARDFPDLKMVIAHMGFPWVNETLTLLAKHKNVFADVSWLLDQPWQAYQSLLSACEYGVIDKLLFASGFPYTEAATCIEALYGINHFAAGSNLPTIPRSRLQAIVERDALHLLGISQNGSIGMPIDPTGFDEEEE